MPRDVLGLGFTLFVLTFLCHLASPKDYFCENQGIL